MGQAAHTALARSAIGNQTRADLHFYRDDRFLKSSVIIDGRPLLEVAEQERQEQLADGWADPMVAM
jgi:hypothetical protein